MTSPLNTSDLLQVDGAGGGSTSTLSAGFTFTAGNDAVFECAHWNNNAGQYITSVTIGGTAATLIARAANGQFVSEQWLANNITGGTQNVAITFGASSSGNYLSGGVQEWDAADNLTYDTGTANNATGTGTEPSVSTATTTSQADTVVIACATAGVGGNTNVGLSGPTGWAAAWTEQDDNNHVAGRGAYSEETTVGTKTATFSQSASGNWAATIAAYTVTPSVSPPVIDVEPNSRAANVGGIAEFYCHANSNGGTGGAYQWATNDGGGWTNVGTNSPLYTRTGVIPGDDGLQVRCTYSDSVGSDVSAIATLSVISTWPALAAFSEFAFSEVTPEGGAAAPTVKVWNGSAWVDGVVKRWNGSAWDAVAAVKRWSGSAWV